MDITNIRKEKMMLPEGVKIEYAHYRVPRNRGSAKGEPPFFSLYRYYRDKDKMKPNEKGGKTICYIRDPNGNNIAVGEATCSMSDNFCYRIGREIALGRALKKLENGK